MDRNLIFDIGMHKAKDTFFYLKKGFKVVAVEANADFVNAAQAYFTAETASGALHIVHAALTDSEEDVEFYLNRTKDDWSSIYKDWAQKGGHDVEVTRVRSTNLHKVVQEYGVPYYIKCDIEGADGIFVDQLLHLPEKPQYVSVEAVHIEYLAKMYCAGYSKFMIVNQALSWNVQCPNPPREGNYFEMKFDGHMSGLFGQELPPDRWIGFEEACSLYLHFKTLVAKYPDIFFGWLDFHAAR